MQKTTPTETLPDASDAWTGNRTLGTLVIAGGDIPRLMDGREVDVHLLRSQSGANTFTGFAGTARVSPSGTTISVRIAARVMALPLGEKIAIRPISLSPVIDADREQARVSMSRAPSPRPRPAFCCRTCGALGDYLRGTGAWLCRRHQRPVAGWRVCDDYFPPANV